VARAQHEDDAVLEALFGPPAPQRAALEAWGLPGVQVLMLMSSCEGRCFFCAQPEVLDMPAHMVTRSEAALAWVGGAEARPGDRLLVGGTEPATHPVLLDAVRSARDRGFGRVEVMTSGVRLGSEARRWAEAGITAVCVPLYASDAARHDAVVRVPGHHARVTAGLDAARDAGIEVSVHTLALRATLDDLATLAAEVAARWGTRLAVAPLREKERLFVYGDAAPTLRDVEIAVRAAHVTLTGFPACVAPEVPRGAPGIIAVYFRGQRTVKGAACAACSLVEACPGVVPAHLTLHGEADLRPR